MDPIYRELAERLEGSQSLALAILAETRGSTPQKCGAKALFLPDGQVVGTLGGGCLEAEIRQKALRALDTGQPLLVRVVLDGDFGWDDGLICGGAVQVFVEPNPRSRAVFLRLLENPEPRQRQVLATIVAASDPAAIGARALFAAGQVLIADAIPPATLSVLLAKSDELLAVREPPARLLTIAEPSAPVQVYFEPILPGPVLIVCGGGHVGAAVGRLAAACGFEVVAVDDRAAFANRERFPDARTILVDDPARVVREFPVDEDTYIVIVTRGHRHDAQVLREAIHRPAAYVGMIGSRRKLRMIMEGFIAEGIAQAGDFRRVHSPMGLAIGSVTVEEIAVSIVAELIAVRRGQSAVGPLSLTGELAGQTVAPR